MEKTPGNILKRCKTVAHLVLHWQFLLHAVEVLVQAVQQEVKQLCSGRDSVNIDSKGK